MWSKHDLILCMAGRQKLPNNLVRSLLNLHVSHGMLRTYWKPFVSFYQYFNLYPVYFIHKKIRIDSLGPGQAYTVSMT